MTAPVNWAPNEGKNDVGTKALGWDNAATVPANQPSRALTDYVAPTGARVKPWTL